MPILAAFRFTALFLLVSVASAGAVNRYPPGPPYRTCPDTLGITDVQQVDTLVAPCHPTVLDTVRGVGGIVIGFDAKPTQYSVFFEHSQGLPWSGVQAFTGSFNYAASPFSLALGDSIVVYGTVQEFPTVNGSTLIEGPDANLTTNDIVIRKVSSGNALPPFKILSTHDMNWVPGSESPAPRQEPWEECLVRIRGPLKVARTAAQNGFPTLPPNSFLVVNVSGPADSALIDGNSFTTVTPPPVSTTLDSVQGIVIQNTSSSVNSYRITLRSAGDLFTVGAPNLVDAYPISDTYPAPHEVERTTPTRLASSNETLRLVFDRALDPVSAQNKDNYNLSSGPEGSTVDAATLEGGSGPVVLLSVTDVRVRGDVEGINATSIGASNCPGCINSNQVRTFINGVLRVADIQTPSPDSLAVCQDRSRYAGTGLSPGTRVTVRGVGTGIFGPLQCIEDATGGSRSGVPVYGPPQTLTRGHRFLMAGQIEEFAGETQLVGIVYQQDQATVTEPAAAVFTNQQVVLLRDTGCDPGQNQTTGEDYEGTLIHVDSLRVTEHRTLGQSFFAARPGGTVANDTILISNLNGVLNAYVPPDSGSLIDVTGILHFANGTFRICPRSASDVNLHVTAGVEHARGVLAFRVAHNPAPTARLRFALARSAAVRLAVYDLLGREIAVLAHGPFAVGVHELEWDGRDARGNEVGAGVFWYRLTVGREVLTTRSVRLR